MEEHECIRLYLDLDTTGQNCSQNALSLSNQYKDESCLYQTHNDLNDWLVNFGKAQKKSLGYKPRRNCHQFRILNSSDKTPNRDI